MQSFLLAFLLCPFLILEIWFSRLVLHRFLSNPFLSVLSYYANLTVFLLFVSNIIAILLTSLFFSMFRPTPLRFMIISLPFLLYCFLFYPLLLSIISLSFSCLPKEFWCPFCFCFKYVMFIVSFSVICFIRRLWPVRSLLPNYTSLYPACFMQYFFYLLLFLFHCSIFLFSGLDRNSWWIKA